MLIQIHVDALEKWSLRNAQCMIQRIAFGTSFAKPVGSTLFQSTEEDPGHWALSGGLDWEDTESFQFKGSNGRQPAQVAWLRVLDNLICSTALPVVPRNADRLALLWLTCRLLSIVPRFILSVASMTSSLWILLWCGWWFGFPGLTWEIPFGERKARGDGQQSSPSPDLSR